MNEQAISRVCGLTLRAIRAADAGSYHDRMLRHALGCAMRAKAALRRGEEAKARDLLSCGLGSVRLAKASGPVGAMA